MYIEFIDKGRINMKKPIIGIVGRENIIQKLTDTSVMSTDEDYRKAVIKARRDSIYDSSNSRSRVFTLWINERQNANNRGKRRFVARFKNV